MNPEAMLSAVLAAVVVAVLLLLAVMAWRLRAAQNELLPLRKSQAEEAALSAERARMIAALTQRADALAAALDTERAEGKALAAKCAAVEATRVLEQQQAAETLRLLRDDRELMAQRFRLLADEAVARNGETIAKQNKEQIDATLTPLRQTIIEYQQGLLTAHTESEKERARFAEQIRNLTDTSAKMMGETQSLAEALHGNAQMRGAWCEMILSTILEKSGLAEGEQYSVQHSLTTEDGQRLQADVVVRLPNEQSLVIDAKVSLVAFESYVNAAGEPERAQALDRHVGAIEAQIRSLARKEYHTIAAGSPDFVVMFIPIEAALAVALRARPNLAALAIESHVGLATPTTLMIALRTAANVWSVERRNRNAEAIAERAGKLHDKVVAFVDDMKALGSRLDQARSAYDGAMSRLSRGNGNVLRQIQQLRALGARTGKSLPLALIEDDPEPDAAEPPGEAQAG